MQRGGAAWRAPLCGERDVWFGEAREAQATAADAGEGAEMNQRGVPRTAVRLDWGAASCTARRSRPFRPCTEVHVRFAARRSCLVQPWTARSPPQRPARPRQGSSRPGAWGRRERSSARILGSVTGNKQGSMHQICSDKSPREGR